MEKQYRIKRELLKYYHLPNVENIQQDLESFKDISISLEALEEVEQRVELIIASYNGAEMGLFKSTEIDWSDKEKDLCEKALNNELLDISSLDEDDFREWQKTNDLKIYYDNYFCLQGIKSVLTEYLKQKK